ncbi:hypothetical protein [Alicyclobacillus fodiniaquatilis]|uniref:Uncharacterized protein n=1 Tax=Alicyclobacillus fodiniaquatilis TaxID=1661150 RepID=A0ABW4JEK9_9BACL
MRAVVLSILLLVMMIGIIVPISTNIQYGDQRVAGDSSATIQKQQNLATK